MIKKEHVDEINSMLAGYEAQIIAEGFVVAGCEPYVQQFLNEKDHSDLTMRMVRISNDAKANIRYAERSRDAVQALIDQECDRCSS